MITAPAFLRRALLGASLAAVAFAFGGAPAWSMSDDSLNKPTAEQTCPAGQVFNTTCKACAKTCATGLVWDCDKKACLQKSSRAFSDDELYGYAITLVKQQRYREARDLLWSMKDRDQPRVLNYIGYTTRKLGDVDTGIAFYHKALALDPGYSKAREYLGEGYLQKNDVPHAKEQLMEIAHRCGTSCEEYTALADAIALHLSGEPLPRTW